MVCVTGEGEKRRRKENGDKLRRCQRSAPAHLPSRPLPGPPEAFEPSPVLDQRLPPSH